jgi:hypothetical protein
MSGRKVFSIFLESHNRLSRTTLACSNLGASLIFASLGELSTLPSRRIIPKLHRWNVSIGI